MKTRLLLAVLAALLLLTGCGHKRPLGASFIGEVPRASIPAIARDAAAYLAELYPPGRTAIHVSQTKNRDQAKPGFGAEFENELRNRGFRILPAPGNGPSVVWTIDVLGGQQNKLALEPSVYALFRIEDQKGKKAISRVYDKQGKAIGAFAQGIIAE